MSVKVKSFKGITYNREKINIEKVVTPPYDVITQEQQQEYYNRDNYNIIRLILGKEFNNDDKNNNKYTRAREYFHAWLKENILIQDSEENIYYLEEEFEFGEKKYLRQGFIGIIKLESFSQGNIIPHERTLRGPKKDRFNLIKECKANFSQIFGLYSDNELKVNRILKNASENINPYFSFKFGEIKYNFWKISDNKSINEIKEIMKEKKIFIADGHHRYETALMYRDYMREKLNLEDDKEFPFDYVMMYFCPMEEDGLLVLPTHRLLKNVSIDDNFFKKAENYFIIQKSSFKNIKSIAQGSFLFFDGNEFYLFKIKDEFKSNDKLDVEILEELIFKECIGISDEEISTKEKVDFIKDEIKGIELVKRGEYKGIFILHPPDINKVREISLTKGVLPQKSTYFYPKLLTGLVIYSLE